MYPNSASLKIDSLLKKKMALPVSVPVKILHEALGTTVTVELDSGETFRGNLTSVEDSMNIELGQVVHTSARGKTRELDSCYLRGSNITMFVLPESLRLAPAVQAAGLVRPTDDKGKGRGFGGGRMSKK